MTEKRRQYTKAFKLDAISLVLDQGFKRKVSVRSTTLFTPSAFYCNQLIPAPA